MQSSSRHAQLPEGSPTQHNVPAGCPSPQHHSPPPKHRLIFAPKTSTSCSPDLWPPSAPAPAAPPPPAAFLVSPFFLPPSASLPAPLLAPGLQEAKSSVAAGAVLQGATCTGAAKDLRLHVAAKEVGSVQKGVGWTIKVRTLSTYGEQKTQLSACDVASQGQIARGR